MIAHEVPLSMGFSRQEFRSGLPFPSPVDLLSLGIEPRSPALQADFYHLNHLSLSKVTTILPSRYYYFCLFLSFIWKESYHLYCFGFSLSLRLLVWDSFLLLHVACWLFSLLIVSLVLSCHNSVMFSTPEGYLDKIMFWFGYYESIHENSIFWKILIYYCLVHSLKRMSWITAYAHIQILSNNFPKLSYQFIISSAFQLTSVLLIT